MSAPLTRSQAEDVIYADNHAAEKAIRNLRHEIEALEQQLYEALEERRGAGNRMDRIMDGEATLDQLAEWVEELTGDAVEVIEDPAPVECLGHPAGPFDPMGQTVYCDGSCRVSPLA